MTPQERVEHIRGQFKFWVVNVKTNYPLGNIDIDFLLKRIDELTKLTNEADSIIKNIQEDCQEHYWEEAKKTYNYDV